MFSALRAMVTRHAGSGFGGLLRATQHATGACDLSYKSEAQREARDAQRAHERARGARIIPSYEVLDEIFQHSAGDASVTGRQLLKDYYAALHVVNQTMFQLSERQMKIVTVFLIAGLRKIFGDEIISELDYLLERFDLQEIYEQIVVMMKRRGGKTVAAVTHIACWSVTQTCGNGIVLSTSERVSQMFREQVVTVVKGVLSDPYFSAAYIGKPDRKEILTIVTKHGAVNSIRFYPDNPKIRIHLLPRLSTVLFLFFFCVRV